MKFIYFFVLLSSLSSKGQTDSLQREIDAQVWKPFMKSFNEWDVEGFMSVHSKDAIRVIQDEKQIFGYEKYLSNMLAGKKRSSSSKWKTTLELRFIQRIAADGKAFEVGYYKATSKSADQTRFGYGKFHVLLRKEGGKWKIVMDADARENVDEATFMSGQPPS